MVRSAQFSREDVAQAAFLVVRKEGISNLSARKVAQELGSSTAPVYSNFESMDELESAVFSMAADKLLEFATKGPTDNSFLNMGIGVLSYAWECPRWYLAFSTNQEYGQAHLHRIAGDLLEIMAGIPELSKLSLLERKLLLRKMGIFTHGLALEICTGDVEFQTMEDFFQILEEVGRALTADSLQRHPRPDQELERMATPSWEIVSARTENHD